MTIFTAPTNPLSSTTGTSQTGPLVYRYLSNDLNTLPSFSANSLLREQNIMSVTHSYPVRQAMTLGVGVRECFSHCSPSLLFCGGIVLPRVL
jgi:hypothetical protein